MPEANLDLYVIFNGLKGAKLALESASALARDLGARITLLVAQVVPYPVPLDQPPVSAGFSERIFAELIRETEAEASVRVYLCRDRKEAIREALAPWSLVMMGSRRRWWPDREQMLAWRLRRDGHHVLFPEPATSYPHALNFARGY